MTNPFESGRPPEAERPEMKKTTREEVEARLTRGEHLEKMNMGDLDLSGLELGGRRFNGSDVRGLRLFNEARAERTDIRNTEWRDVELCSLGQETVLAYADAEGSNFGYSETLSARRQRCAGKRLPEQDSGAYLNFNVQQAKLARTSWENIDFGGAFADDGYEARFQGADLKGARFAGCDLSNLDLTESDIAGLVIEDPDSLAGLRLDADQVEAVAAGIRYSDKKVNDELKAALAADGARKLLTGSFGVIIVK